MQGKQQKQCMYCGVLGRLRLVIKTVHYGAALVPGIGLNPGLIWLRQTLNKLRHFHEIFHYIYFKPIHVIIEALLY